MFEFECECALTARPSTLRFRSGSVRTRFTTSGGPPNREPDFRSGSAPMLNFEPDFGPVRKGSGPNRGSELDCGITIAVTIAVTITASLFLDLAYYFLQCQWCPSYMTWLKCHSNPLLQFRGRELYARRK